MTNLINWFEIPVTDMTRARTFYETIFSNTMHEMTLANDLKMALFPAEAGAVGGALSEHKDFYFPGKQGPLIYLNGNPDLQHVLDKVEAAGGSILMPKRAISEQFGFMAMIQDTEGNRIALHSMT